MDVRKTLASIFLLMLLPACCQGPSVNDLSVSCAKEAFGIKKKQKTINCKHVHLCVQVLVDLSAPAAIIRLVG